MAAAAPAPQPAPAVQPVTYSALLARVTPAVVSVFPARLMKEAADDDPLGRFFGRSKEEADKERERAQGLGSGVIISADGWIVTNSHVVHLAHGKVADAISVELSDRRRLPARVAGVDPATDLALLKIAATGLPRLPLGDSDTVKIGDLVFAVGNPFKVGMTATMGMVSAKQRTIGINGPGGFEDFIQTDAAINPGNSGGALVDAAGRLVGINSAIYGGSRGGNVGIGFAIPSNLMRQIIVRLAEEGKVVRGFFGLQIEEVDADAAAAAKLDRIQGAKISVLMDGGPGARAGLLAGDVILQAGGRAVETRAALRIALSLVKPGGELAVELSRGGERTTATLVPIADPEAKGGGTFELASLPGVKFRAGEGTLVVASVTPDAARKTQIEAAMEIIEINGEPAPTASAAEAALRPGVNKVKARAADGERTLAVRIE
ncbi:MAG: trypsin-like peptidase domain-containing protein [Verrucomicrobiota bacterium]|nr:trypsin-like peptidase domain-containing protein [Verrucomicrobiota bacterium]